MFLLIPVTSNPLLANSAPHSLAGLLVTLSCLHSSQFKAQRTIPMEAFGSLKDLYWNFGVGELDESADAVLH